MSRAPCPALCAQCLCAQRGERPGERREVVDHGLHRALARLVVRESAVLDLTARARDDDVGGRAHHAEREQHGLERRDATQAAGDSAVAHERDGLAAPLAKEEGEIDGKKSTCWVNVCKARIALTFETFAQYARRPEHWRE